MRQVTIHEAKTNLSKLIEEALAGEEVIIARRNKPLVRLQVLEEAKSQRQIGWARDLIINISEDFDEPLDDFKEYME